MEKNNNSVLISILCGVGVCFFVLGIVFLIPSKNNSNLKGNDSESFNLGDTQVSCATSEQYCPNGTLSGNSCLIDHGPANVGADDECPNGGIENGSGECIEYVTPSTRCTSCNSNAYLDHYKCYTCGSGTHLKSVGCEGDQCCEVDATPTPSTKTCYVYNSTNDTCYATGVSISFTCDGTTSHSGTIYYSSKTECENANTATPTPTPEKSDTTISNFSDFSLVVGASRQLNATASSGATVSYYVLTGGSYVTLDENYLQAVNQGTATVRASAPATSTHKSATKDITVTVTAPTPTPTPEKLDTTISNFSDFSLVIGQARQLNATASSGATVSYYVLTGGSYVMLDENYLQGMNQGAATVRASAPATSTHKSATKDITVTVTAPTPTPTPRPCSSYGDSQSCQAAGCSFRYNGSSIECYDPASVTPTPVPSQDMCYCDLSLFSNIKCEWRNTNANSWTAMKNITSKEECSTYSTNRGYGCFKKSNGEYVWGQYGNSSNYTIVGGVSTEEVCLTMNDGDPIGDTYSLSCPVSVLLIGDTISCTYSTSGTATLSSGGSTNTSVATAVKDGTSYVKVTGKAKGSVSVYGVASDGKKTNYVPLVVSDQPIPDRCTISISTSSRYTSVDEDNYVNSYYIVQVTIAGADCAGQTATYTATNAKSLSQTSYAISADHGTSTINTSFKVYPKNPCYSSEATATLTNGEKSTTSSVTLLSDWRKTDNVCEKNPAYTSFEAADRAAANVYYTNYGTCSDGSSGYRTKWTRGGCGGGGSSTPTPTPSIVTTPTPTIGPPESPTPTPGVTSTPTVTTTPKVTSTPRISTPIPTPKLYACYKDENNVYHWTFSPKPSWVLVADISKYELCDTPKPGCYEDSNGNFDWGYHSSDSNWNYHPEITDDTLCKKDETCACYKDSNDNYVWSTTQPTGYTKVDLPYSECNKPACYHNRNTGKMVWGRYESNTSYVKLYDDVLDEYGNVVGEEERPFEKCKNEGCYKNKETGDYDWDDHSNDSNFELVESVKEPSQCKNDVPVESTGVRVSTIIYVFMAILMAFGIGFIYYSTVLKQKD